MDGKGKLILKSWNEEEGIKYLEFANRFNERSTEENFETGNITINNKLPFYQDMIVINDSLKY